MRVVMSNLAWDPADDDHAARLLADAGIHGVELAPTKVWPAPLEVASATVDAYRRRWDAAGLPIMSIQSLLFGRPDLQLFDPYTIDAFVDHLCRMARLAGALGAGPMVLGSPRNRTRGSLPDVEATAVAADALRRVAEVAGNEGTCLCIEPNPPQYGADFVTNADEGAALVQLVDHRAFRLHLDMGAMTLAGDDPSDAITRHADILAHFHCSEPNLVALGTDSLVAHTAAASALRASAYSGVVSIETLAAAADPLEVARRSASFAVAHYG